MDEFYAVLNAMRENDPNGNGEKDEVPMTESVSILYQLFGGLYGCFNRGNQSTEYDVDPETGLVRHTKTSDSFRQALEYMHKLYEEGIIDQECITFKDATAVGLMNSVVNFILVIAVNTISKRASEVSLW